MFGWNRRFLLSMMGVTFLAQAGALSATIPADAPLDPEFLAWHRAKTGEKSDLQVDASAQDAASKTGYVPSPLDLSHLRRLSSSQPSLLSGAAIAFPPVYDLRALGGVTAVRDQTPYGTCWAFAALGSLESTQLKSGRGTFDLSEWHLAWYAYNDFDPNRISFTKKMPPPFGEGHDTFNQGGNNWKSAAILARGTGAADEMTCPYLSQPPMGTEPVRVNLQEVLFLGSEIGIEDMKTALMTWGAVSIAFWWDPSKHNVQSSAYRYVGDGTNHMVDIVGWDDNFPASNFLPGNQPSSNGAWIVRNSYSPYWYMSKEGYFFMSYDSILKDGGVFMGGGDSYSQVYQHDPLGWINSRGNGTDTAWFANLFTAQGTEQIQAVSFYVGAANAGGEISIRTGVSGNPASGVLALDRQAFLFEVPGYRTVKLSSPVPISAGDKFAVFVKLTTPGYNAPIPIESQVPDYSDKAMAGVGESFESYDGVFWSDLAISSPNANVCLKAFAAPPTNTPPTITPIANQILSEDTPKTIPFTLGDAETPAASLSLEATSSNPYVLPVANIVFGGSGASRTVTITPAANRFGTGNVRVKVSDGSGGTNSTLFSVTVNAVNDIPTITPIADQTLDANTSRTIPFTIGDAETPAASLSLVATSSNTSLIPVANIVFGGSGASRTVTITPAANRYGTGNVRVKVIDGSGAMSSTLFSVTVSTP